MKRILRHGLLWVGYILAIVIGLIGMAGCSMAPKECNAIKVPQKCEVQPLHKPLLSIEAGDDATWLKAVIENNGKRQSYIYDLEAAIDACR